MKRYDYEVVERMFSEIGLTLLEDNYKSVDQKMLCEDKDGYRYIRTLRTVMDKRDKTVSAPHVFSSKNPMAWYNIQHYVDKFVDNGTKLASGQDDYVNSDSKLLFVCGQCGKTYWKRFLDFKHDENKVCPSCYKVFIQDNPNKKPNDRAVYEEMATKIGLRILGDGKIRYHANIEVEDADGYRGLMSVAAMSRGCSFKKYYIHNPYTIYNMRRYVELNGGDCIVENQKFLGDKSMMRFKCSCGNEYTTSLNHFINDKKFKCNECRLKQSNIAKDVELYLKTICVEYIKEKTFNDCVGYTGRCLPFDFYLTSLNACIEVDGIGHYKAIPWGGMTKDDAKQHLAKRVAYDATKTGYCKAHDIPLLRLPFWYIENSEQYKDEIDKFILSVQG